MQILNKNHNLTEISLDNFEPNIEIKRFARERDMSRVIISQPYVPKAQV